MLSPQQFDNQLKLFMGGGELKQATLGGNMIAGDRHTGNVEQVGRMWQDKEQEARQPLTTGEHGAGVYDAIKTEGIRTPVGIGSNHDAKNELQDGHHRVAAAAALEKERGHEVFVPVAYSGVVASEGSSPRGKYIGALNANQRAGEDAFRDQRRAAGRA